MIVESYVNSCQIILIAKNESHQARLYNLALSSDKSPVHEITPRHLNNFISLRRQAQPQFRKFCRRERDGCVFLSDQRKKKRPRDRRY